MADEGKKEQPRPTTERRQRATGTYHAIQSIKANRARERSTMDRAAERLTRIAASLPFLIVHIVWFFVWIVGNSGLFGSRFDPFPFGLLTMIVSLEAIFLSIFVLMTQAREAETAELREEVTLQVLLRTEEEVTKTLQLVVGLYSRLGHELAEDAELQAMIRPLDAAEIERQMLAEIRAAKAPLLVSSLLNNKRRR
ncbi:MAG TPA: DUF1003 domain-containing protein [Gemmatimonadaceae bacterium]|nr:DUF1003 domain-containing protein [Gemmatimonadaceae bacterium]